MVETQSEKKIKGIRSDRGSEYASQEFIKFLEEAGIQRQLTVSYTPQQNGVAERRNRTLLEMARSMLKTQGMPDKFWSEAVFTAAYLQNRLSTKSLNKQTPLEVWSNHKPSVSHLRVFGCICHVLVPEEKRKKLDDKSRRGVFIGYSTLSKGYKVYMLDISKVEVSRDVIFEEDKVWNWEKQDIATNQLVSHLETVKNIQRSSRQHAKTGPETTPQEDTSESETSTPRTGKIIWEESEDSPGVMRKTKSLNDIYSRAVEIEELSNQVEEFCCLSMGEPTCFEEAVENRDWRLAMEEEIRMINKNNTWYLTEIRKGKKTVGVKWIYKIKTDENGKIQKLKARLVARGFSQTYGVDYNETFAPVSRHDTIRMILAVAAQKRWSLHQLDVKSAFLNGEISEEV